MIMTHGWGKLAGFSTMSANFMGGGAGLGLSVFAEFFCALGVVFGLFFRLALIPLIINMSVAFVAVHGAAISGNGSGEMALLYLAVFVSMLIAGPGQYAMDRMFVRRPGERD